jgi:hypothetical protein
MVDRRVLSSDNRTVRGDGRHRGRQIRRRVVRDKSVFEASRHFQSTRTFSYNKGLQRKGVLKRLTLNVKLHCATTNTPEFVEVPFHESTYTLRLNDNVTLSVDRDTLQSIPSNRNTLPELVETKAMHPTTNLISVSYPIPQSIFKGDTYTTRRERERDRASMRPPVSIQRHSSRLK